MQAFYAEFSLSALCTGADLGGGCGGVHPPSPEMTCGFLKQLVFCIEICLRHQLVTPLLSGALLPKKNPGSAPAFRVTKRSPN